VTATGFDTARYVESQTARIQERLAHFGTRLYLEFDGFVDRDRHAERVLPGFDPDSKLQVMRGLGDQLEVLICVNARALATEDRLQASLGAGRTADLVVLQAVDGWTSFGVDACAVVINRFDGQREARNLRDQLEVLGVRVYTQPELPSLPADLDRVVGAQGWGRFPSIATRRPIVLVTGLALRVRPLGHVPRADAARRTSAPCGLRGRQRGRGQPHGGRSPPPGGDR
jgi:uncharacterized protein (UPF0371 family)